MTTVDYDADVIVVGAGPGGSTTAYHLARHGVRVLLLEKTEFPREKVCGDGLTPRAVKQLVKLGVDTSPEAGWLRNRGLRVIGGGVRLELDWPELASFPNYGLVRTRLDFDDLLAKRAVEAGAELRTGVNVTGPVLDESGRVVGVTAESGPDKAAARFSAPLVIAADGVSGRLPLALGINKREDRPIGVAVRRYYRSPAKHDDNYLESWLELRSKEHPDKLLPGYGWIFGMGDGRVNVGLGALNSSAAFGKTNYRRLLVDWLAGTPAEWGMTDETNADGPILGAALPMGFNRVPHYTRGVLLVGDSGGMVNPFNGEGIAYAMESGELAAEIVVQALARPAGAERERALAGYPAELKARYGGYYRLGNIFVKMIGNPHVMRIATKHGMPHPTLMRFVLKLLANLTDPRGGDAMDRVINAMTKAAPAV
ncbi:geranylgeranyl reductase family protein [Plantactinospora sp. KLBMP9567]|uniref:geranylgeranyl reductase family protein n=1 Tax=Plantactinospora sp. KLBMP9567 TaxID=3085900 RepID=UPI002982A60C|nr:geranylgeranyl reductase family protein [Plantactinospora sp. KLBMP9567]MDW5329140.1 geranylgeranyl reductase family protein [Plantactinospora sp. KLBMP9567]MDW5329956.1 geranylgeranyl reductase family protein [Plantactinospora sp. KLBMP9567]